MSHSKSVAWKIFCFFSFFNQCVLVSSRDFPPVISGHSVRHRFVSRAWTEWSAWSECSRTCGGGVRQRTRSCRVRMVEYRTSSNTCVGDRIDYDICSRHACQTHEDFLAYQCSKKNGQVVSGRKIKEWIPYRYGKGNPCELQCWAEDFSLVYSFGKAVDGTPCPPSDPRDSALCVNGRCTPVDCTGQLGTDNRRDICGICRGENATCVKHHSIFWKSPRPRLNGVKDRHYDYNDIFTIPAGATHIKVTEDSLSNFLVLGDHKDHYLINGNWRVQSPGRFLVHGSEFLYNRTLGGFEELSSAGPTRSALNVLVLGTGDIPTVHYEFWVSTFKPHFPHPVLPVQTPEPPKRTSELLHPLDNTIETPASKFLPPKLPGYKSYYHRNEILKSVPSWSIKRHRNHKNPDLLTFSDHQPHSGNRTWDKSEEVRFKTSLRPVVKDTNKSFFEYQNNLGFGKNRTGERYDVRFQTTIPMLVRNVDTTTPLIVSTSDEVLSSTFRHDRGFERPTGTSAFTRINHVLPKKEIDNLVVTPGSVRSKTGGGERKRGKKKEKSKGKDGTSPKRRRKADNGCPVCPRVKQQTKNFCRSDFVLRATVISIAKLPQGIRFELEVTQSFKNRVPILSREYIWGSGPNCVCPRLREGREYILMGHSSSAPTSRESKLVVDRDSFVRRYSLKRAKAILRLVRDQGIACKRISS